MRTALMRQKVGPRKEDDDSSPPKRNGGWMTRNTPPIVVREKITSKTVHASLRRTQLNNPVKIGAL